MEKLPDFFIDRFWRVSPEDIGDKPDAATLQWSRLKQPQGLHSVLHWGS
jgi:hypothetical protein